MINQGRLSKKEKELIKKWNCSDSDYEIFFGSNRDYNSENSLDEVVQYTSIIRFDKSNHGIAFPLFGANLDKKEMAELEVNLIKWTNGAAAASSGPAPE